MRAWLESNNPGLVRSAATGFVAAALAANGQIGWARQALMNRAASPDLRDDVAGALLAAVGDIGVPDRPRAFSGSSPGRIGPAPPRAETPAWLDASTGRKTLPKRSERSTGSFQRRTSDLPLLALRAVGLLGDISFAWAINGTTVDAPEPIHRGVATLAVARLQTIDVADLARRKATFDTERAFIDLARLYLTRDETLVPQISQSLSRTHPLDAPFEQDFRSVLRDAGGIRGVRNSPTHLSGYELAPRYTFCVQ